jgi:calcium-translocating P-type ATPase|nr:MAG TPA: Cation transport ATPase [Caudoviricetes sp.]
MKINKEGLSNQEVEQSREKYGANRLPEKVYPTIWERITNVFKEDGIMTMLFVLAILEGIEALVCREIPWECIGIMTTVSVVTFFTINSDLKQEKSFKDLKASIQEPTVTVIREGRKQIIKQSDLVVGDICLLNNGEKAYADGLIIEQTDFKISNAELNGESDEVEVDTFNYVENSEVEFTDDVSKQEGFINSGALIVNGKATMGVVRVGENTESGKALVNVTEMKTPLLEKLDTLTEQITRYGAVGATLMFAINFGVIVLLKGGLSYFTSTAVLSIGLDIVACLMVALSIFSASAPEGLPFVINLVLSANVNKMKKHNVLLKNVKKGETSGSLSILFSDKTGTMTKNIMSIVEFTDGTGKTLNRGEIENSKYKELIDRSIVMSSDSYYDENGDLIGGNGTDRAFSKFVGADLFKQYSNSTVIKSQPFNSKNKYNAVQLDGYTIYKGAGEILVNNSKNLINTDCWVRGIEEEDRENLQSTMDRMMNKAERVLAIAISKQPLVDNELPSDLTLLAVFGIRDEIRESTPTAIENLNNAGVQVVMVTGDNIKTADAIAKEIGLLKDGDLSFTNDILMDMTDEEIASILPKLKVVGRAKPDTKRRLNHIAQNNGYVTGMCGDGVNDAPALMQADIGFAMGSGTDVAKDAGDVVILDNNLASIEYGVKSGRQIFKNIQKFLKYQLAINVGIVITPILASLCGVTKSLAVTSILWINAIMDTLASLAFSGEPCEDSVMKEKPISRTANIINKDMMIQIATTGLYFIGTGLFMLTSDVMGNLFGEKQTTAYFSLFVMIAIFNGFNVRTASINCLKDIKKNPRFIKIMALITVLQVLLVSFGGKIFDVMPMNLMEWLIVTGIAVLIIPIDLIRKMIMNKTK